jgi:quinol monooxygenase YgiN
MTESTRDIFITASATAKNGHEKTLEEALREAAVATRKQRGCVEFLLLRVKDDPTTFIGIERWKSEADHQAHLGGAHIQKLMTRLGPILESPPSIVSYEVIDG